MNKSVNIFTVDVEEYYHAENICRSLPPEKLRDLPDRVEVGVNKLLELLARYSSHATFFVLGCVAEKNPALIKRIADAGHEIASHGYGHIPLYRHTPGTFEDDLGRSVQVLSGIIGRKIIGYRATSFSLAPGIEWFFQILKKRGMTYDSSLSLSLFRRHYRELWEGGGAAKTNDGILEFPLSYVDMGLCKLPIGGGYFRVYPYWLTKCGLSQTITKRRMPPLFYIHPWELDPMQPRVRIPAMNYVRHYLGLGRTERLVQTLLSDMRFDSIAGFLSSRGAS